MYDYYDYEDQYYDDRPQGPEGHFGGCQQEYNRGYRQGFRQGYRQGLRACYGQGHHNRPDMQWCYWNNTWYPCS